MYPYSQSVHPALRSHIDAQMAFANELSQAISCSFQQIGQLNMQLTRTLFEQAASAGQRWLTAERPAEALSAAVSHAQPATDTLNAYRQQLSRIASATQVDLAQVSERHVPETSRTARALAEDVTRVAAEEGDSSRRQREASAKEFRDPFEQHGKRAVRTGANGQSPAPDGADHAGMRVDADWPDGKVSAQGTMQGNQVRHSGGTDPCRAR